MSGYGRYVKPLRGDPERGDFKLRAARADVCFAGLAPTWDSLAPIQANLTECLLSDIAENAVCSSYLLREFSARFATQVAEGIGKTPLRTNHHLAPPKDMVRVWRAERGYYKGFLNLYRDYPRELWD
jgi:hypothetical protein